jgi:cytoskeleton protein RodZ
LPSFGQKLKLEREQRKISLEDISVSTKIGIRMLRALEEDNFEQLPGGIFNKGFVRAYARVLGLDEEQTVADYMQASGGAVIASVGELETDVARTDAVKTGGKFHRDDAHVDGEEEDSRSIAAAAARRGQQIPWGIFAGLLLITALTLSLWSRYERQSARRSTSANSSASESSPPAPQSSTQTPENAANAAVPASTSASNAQLGQTSGKDRAIAPSGQVAPRSGSGPSSTSGVNSGPAKSAPAGAAVAGEFSLVVRAREESWITITSDGTTVASELLAAGSERKVQGRQQITVKAGNAGGVEFQFNGKKVDAGGQYGEVKTLTFGPQGLI